MEGLRDPERDAIMRREIRAAGLGGLLAWYPEDLVLCAGSHTCNGVALCLYPAEGDPVFYASRFEPPDVVPPGFLHRSFTPQPGAGPDAWAELSALLLADLGRLGLKPGDVGIPHDGGQHALPSFPGETPPLTETSVRAALRGGAPADGTAAFTAAGLRKSARETAAVRRANAAAGAGLAAFYAALTPGRSEAETASLVESAVQGCSGHDGVRLARGWAHVQGGENIFLGGTYSRTSANRLRSGDMVLLELATCADGYWSDLTRTGCVGRPGERELAILTAVSEAQAAAIAAVRPGVSHESVDAAARSFLAARGMAEGFTHACGHQVGFRYHDRGPVLEKGSSAPLAAGMIITVEPGTYGRALGGGARFEDDVLVTDAGAEVLSPIGIRG
jgi:Xaa-Pro dipeptidase